MSEVVLKLTYGIAPYLFVYLIIIGTLVIIKVLFEKFSNKVENIIDNRVREKCPKCGNNILKKKGKYGYFIGCSNYPECNYTRNIK